MSKSLVGKLLEASKLITQARISKASYISLKEDYIKELAVERGVSFDEMIEIIKKELKKENK